VAVPRFTPSQTLPLEGEGEMMEKPIAETIEALYVCNSHCRGKNKKREVMGDFPPNETAEDPELTFRVLIAGPRTPQTVFLSLLGSGVSCEHGRFFQGKP
jgi:hypothetical protein